MNQNPKTCASCTCKHHSIMPVLVILFGLTFLLGSMGVLMASTVSTVWPILVILGGIMKLMGRRCGCCCGK